MDIQIFHLIEGSQRASGLAVVIDVFRAFTVACYAFANGAADIIPVGEIKTAYALKEAHPEAVLMGERSGRIQPGFDFGNSPAEIETVDMTGKTIIHTTSAGTQGIVNAVKADEIITGSFVNAGAIARYIKSRKPTKVSLVCMGDEGLKENQEDTFCADYINSLLMNTTYDLEAAKEALRIGSGKRFFGQQTKGWYLEGDFNLAMAFNRFDFVLRAQKRQDGFIHLNKVHV